MVDIPGPQGPAGTNGTNGTNGLNAYTTVTNPFTMPAEAASVAVDVGATGWMTVGQKVFIGKAASAAKGTFQVAIVNTATNVTLTNVADTATSAYTENSAPGTVFPAGSAVSPSGLQGPAGTPGASGAPTTATYITQTPDAGLSAEQALSLLGTGLMFSTTATGVITIKTVGIAASNIAPVDAGAALTAGQVVQVVAGGLKSDTAANTRTLLGAAASGLATASGLTTSATDKVIGRSSAGAGAVEEIICTATGRSIISQASIAAVQSLLGINVSSVVTKTSGYVATIADDVILVDATTGSIIIDLYAAATGTGRSLVVKKIDASANTVTIRGHLAETIDGSNTKVINSQWTAVDMVCDGTAFYIK